MTFGSDVYPRNHRRVIETNRCGGTILELQWVKKQATFPNEWKCKAATWLAEGRFRQNNELGRSDFTVLGRAGRDIPVQGFECPRRAEDVRRQLGDLFECGSQTLSSHIPQW